MSSAARVPVRHGGKWMSGCKLGRCWLVHTRVVVVVDHIVLFICCIVSYLLVIVGLLWAVGRGPWAVGRVAGKVEGFKSRVGCRGFHYNFVIIVIVIIIIIII